nr:MAG TPA: hypothetical protein [Caudoviricetes sp.]
MPVKTSIKDESPFFDFAIPCSYSLESSEIFAQRLKTSNLSPLSCIFLSGIVFYP